MLALWVTRTTLNIESFMGAIMAVGVAVSNAIMLVSFGDRHRLEEGMPADRAAITAAKGRLRPIIMTACAMISGMIPMSLGLEEGSEQNAPLGRAVIGGMAFATFATLLVLPAVFTLLLGRCLQPVPLARPGRPGERALRPDPPAHDGHAHHATAPDGHPAAEPPHPTDHRRTHPMPTPTHEPRMSRIHRAVRKAPTLVALALCLAAGCGHSDRGGTSANRKAAGAEASEGKTAGIRVIRPERRDIRMTVVQPGTIQAFEVTPVYSRISGYVEKYRYNIGDRVKAAPVLAGHDRAEVPLIGDLAHEFGVEVLVAIVLARAIDDLLVGEVARGLADQALLVCEFEVHSAAT